MLASEETLSGRNRKWIPVDLLTGDEATSPAAAGSSRSTAVSGFSKFLALLFVCDVQGATGGTLDVVIEHSNDKTDWYEYAHLTQLAAGAAAACVTFAAAESKAIGAVGKNNAGAPVLAAGTAGAGPCLDALRVRLVAGAGTSAGAVQGVRVYGLVAAP